MLTRIRIEVEGENSAATTEMTLDKYEAELMAFEAGRFDLSFAKCDWEDIDGLRALLGREVTDEVIEYDPGLPGYKGRRVVKFKRWDSRSEEQPYVETIAPPPSNTARLPESGNSAPGHSKVKVTQPLPTAA